MSPVSVVGARGHDAMCPLIVLLLLINAMLCRHCAELRASRLGQILVRHGWRQSAPAYTHCPPVNPRRQPPPPRPLRRRLPTPSSDGRHQPHPPPRGDKDNLNESNFDKFAGYSGSLFDQVPYDEDDEAADQVWNEARRRFCPHTCTK